jgi:hypothetical protein
MEADAAQQQVQLTASSSITPKPLVLLGLLPETRDRF